MRIAITREVSPGIARCELTHLDREPIDLPRAQAQHEAYVRALAACGCRIVRLPAEPDLPDSVFVEDTAIVLDELAILTHPGAASRRPEVASIRSALEAFRRIAAIAPPATLDGGDVLLIDRRLYVGISTRSDGRAVEQLRAILTPIGYEAIPVPVRGCLHLKSAVTRVGPDCLLVNARWVDASTLPPLQRIEVHPDESHGGNALLVGQKVIYPAAFPRTRERLERAGVAVESVDLSELAKAEGGVTCCSLIFQGP